MDIDELRRLAAKEEISLNFIAKDEMISKALLALQGFDNIILKGGTAINRVYLKNKRFSEDIDFDIIFKGNAKQAIPITKDTMKSLNMFDAAKPRIMKDTIRYDLFYTNPLSHKDKIRIEFKVIRKSKGYGKKVVNFGFAPYNSALLNVYDIEELIKHKVECIINRLEGKDFFDLYYLIELSNKLRISKGEKENIINKISMEEKEIKAVANIINHYIPKKNRPIWSIFLDELKEKVNLF